MSEKLVNYIKEHLIKEIHYTSLTEKTCEDIQDGIEFGRKELAEMLIQRIAGYEQALKDQEENDE